MDTTTAETTTAPLQMTDAAAAKVRDLLSRETSEAPLALRVAVQPGGCSGMKYSLYFDDQIKDTDILSEFGDVRLVVDKKSAPYLRGATVDFIDSLQRSGFTIDNPNAQHSCACGDSFQ